MATTTNYGWTTPDDTDLVKDGASAIRTLGSAVDTTTKNLNPETTLGDMSFRSATSNVNTRLPIGSSGQHLTVVAGVPAWATASDQTPLTTKGDIFTFSTLDTRLGVGANGTVLQADSAEATGLKWATPSDQTPLTTKGDLFTFSTVDARLGVGTNTHVLTADSAEATGLKWAAPASGSSFVGAKSTKSVVQSIANATVSLITFDTDTFDTDAIHDVSTNNTRFTVPAGKAGKWSFTTTVAIASGGGTLRQIRYGINGTVFNITSITPISGDSTHFSRTDIFSLSVADYVEVGTYQDSGGALNCLATNNTTAAFYYLGA